jgi:hypothetical protein
MEKNYRIRVEALDGAPSVIPEAWAKNKCEGFALIIYDGKRWNYIVENVTKLELANGILRSPELTEAGMIAQGIINAIEYHNRNMEAELKKMMEGASNEISE